jgi:hypothetical protein
MVEQTLGPVSRVDIDKLYTEALAPESWLELELRTVELLESGNMAENQTRALLLGLHGLQEQGETVPDNPGDLYLRIRPILEQLPEPLA